jgi:hypothetical protein
MRNPRKARAAERRSKKEFRPLFAFVGTKAQAENAPVEKYHAESARFTTALTVVSADQLKEISQELANDKDDRLKLRASETAISNLLKGFGESLAAQEISSLLQEPLGNLKELLGADRKTQIGKVWSERILVDARKIEKGYPFEDSETESDLNDLKNFLNPTDGKLSVFFNEDLKKYLKNRTGNGKSRIRAPSSSAMSSSLI